MSITTGLGGRTLTWAACYAPKTPCLEASACDGAAAKDLQVKPHDLGAAKVVEQPDGALFWKITEGRKPMPSFEKLIGENERWQVQARFWSAVAARGAASPAVFCYDLMNEPVVPGGKRQPGDWLADRSRCRKCAQTGPQVGLCGVHRQP